MNVKIDRSFEKDVQKIKNKALLKKIAVQIKLVQKEYSYRGKIDSIAINEGEFLNLPIK